MRRTFPISACSSRFLLLGRVLGRLRLLAVSTLVLGGILLVGREIRERSGLAEFAELRGSLAGRGGVVFVRYAEDCAATAGAVEYAAAALQEQGVVVQGVILERGPVEVAVRIASEAFPHRSMSLRAAAALGALGSFQTPFAMVIDTSGTIVRLEEFDHRPLGAILRSLGLGA